MERDLIKEYKEIYRKVNGKEALIEYKGGWVTISSITKVRLTELPQLIENLKRRLEPFREKFLDYEIVNTWNSDGFVVVRNVKGKEYQHCGNYSTLDDAKDSAILYFMIARPEKFSSSIFHRLIGTKTMHEWFTFKKVIEEEGLEMPEGIYCRGMSCTIGTEYPSFVKNTAWEKRDNGN